MPYVLPTPEPRQTFWDIYGSAAGRTIDVLAKAILGQMASGGGQFSPKNIPNPGYGQTGGQNLTFPGGASTRTNPQELSQIQRLGGVPTRQGLSNYGTSITPPTPYASQPMINQQQFGNLKDLQSLQLQQSQIASNRALAQQRSSGRTTTIVTGVDADGNPTTFEVPASNVKVVTQKNKSARELAAESEFNATGTQTNTELPDPKSYSEGTIIKDTTTNKRYQLSNGAWTPL